MSTTPSDPVGLPPRMPTSKEEMKERNPFTLADLEAALLRVKLKLPGLTLDEVLKMLREGTVRCS